VVTGVVVEELARANFYLAMLVLPATVSGQLLERHLAPELAPDWLPGLVSGRLVLGIGVTEPAAGSDVSGLVTRAVRADGGWRLSGEKNSVTHAPHAAGTVVFAKTTPDAGARGVTAFLVPAGAPGVRVHPLNDAGWRPLGRGAVLLDDVFVPDSHVLGPVDGGFRVIMRSFDFTRSLIGLICVGVAQRALETTTEYVAGRTAFGRPVVDNQGVSFPLAEHATTLEAARWLCYRTLALADSGLPHTKEAAMVKWWAPRVAIDALRDCVVLNGHGGYSEDLPYQALLRDLSGFELGDGTPQIQKTIIAREMLRASS
jgi:cyclohexanecarboxyl-CoA dehydrogenase